MQKSVLAAGVAAIGAYLVSGCGAADSNSVQADQDGRGIANSAFHAQVQNNPPASGARERPEPPALTGAENSVEHRVDEIGGDLVEDNVPPSAYALIRHFLENDPKD
jgi:hypothetical protein